MSNEILKTHTLKVLFNDEVKLELQTDSEFGEAKDYVFMGRRRMLLICFDPPDGKIPLMTIETWNKRQAAGISKGIFTAIECPWCYSELVFSNENFLLSDPPQREIHCPICAFKETVLA